MREIEIRVSPKQMHRMHVVQLSIVGCQTVG